MVEKRGCLISSLLMVLAAVIVAAGLTSCTKKEGGVQESWAYIHDKGTEILALNENGSAKFKGENYTYEKGEDYIELTAKDGQTLHMRFIPEGEHMLLYERLVYTYEGEGTPDGLTGFWRMGNQSFEFTEKGTFKEDEFFPGHYLVNEDEKSIRLAYNDHFVDAILYYEIEGSELIIDYPMPVVPTQETDDEK